MSAARGFLRLAKRYERRMEYCHDEMVKNRSSHITQLREVMKCVEHSFEISYGELESWADSIESVYSVDEFDNIFQRVELVFLKMYVNWRYSQALNEVAITEDAKKRLQSVLNKLEVLNAFRWIWNTWDLDFQTIKNTV